MLVRRYAALALVIVLARVAPAGATVMYPLDTLAGDFASSTEAYPVYGSFEWQEIAVPFHLTRAGRLLSIQTGLYYGSGTSALLIGIGQGELPGRSFPSSVFETPICGTVPDRDGRNYCQEEFGDESINLAPGEFLDWRGSLFLDSGDYWLYASLIGDDVFGGWYANPKVVRDDWATRSCALGIAQGNGCYWNRATWDSVTHYGPETRGGGPVMQGGTYATPMARITVAPVSEPSSVGVFALGLLLLITFRGNVLRSGQAS